MAVAKKNLYVPGVNSAITTLFDTAIQKGFDLTQITWNGSAYVVAVGSTIEANGNLYEVETSAVTVTAATGVLVFDTAGLTFSISALAPVWDNTKGADYVSATLRVCRWRCAIAGQYERRLTSNMAQVLSKRVHRHYGNYLPTSGWLTNPVYTSLPAIGQYLASGYITPSLARDVATYDMIVSWVDIKNLDAINNVGQITYPGIMYYGLVKKNDGGSITYIPYNWANDAFFGGYAAKWDVAILDRLGPT